MSSSTAGPSRYPSLSNGSENGSSPSFSPIPEGNQSWSSGHPHSNGYPAGDEEASGRGEAGSKRNPLVDLIDSEKAYVDQLALVIRRVAAAWSRKDFPPPKLDAMFRCVEAVFRANRGFGAKLKEIGPNPSSPKALGDLLMRWIDDLEPAYSKYCTSYMTGFDTYTPVTRNTLLPGILSDISTSTPPSPPLEQWTLDALFLLPYSRLRYYRKLYARLLRSTKEGRSDHRLLLVANQRLEVLVSQVESRLEVDVADEDGPTGNKSAPGSTGERSRESSWTEKGLERESRASSGVGSSRGSHTNFSPFSSRIEDRSSAGSAATSMTQSPQRRPTPTTTVPIAKSPPNSATMPLSDLELRIDTERAIDLFTMSPKRCKLQMNPPTLPYRRSLRSSHDVTIHFNPTSTGQTVIHRRAHVFILTDLFIVAEWMEAADKANKAQQVAREQPERVGQGGPMPEMWLCYPPLAGKHLMVAEGQQGNELSVMIMRKETFVLHAESDIAKDSLVKDLLDCVEFASTVSRKNTITPMPAPTPDSRSPSAMSDTRSQESFPPLRYPSPFSAASSPSTSPRPGDTVDNLPGTIGGNALVSQMSRINLEPGETIAWQRPSPPPPPHPAAPAVAPPGSILPPRGASLRPRQTSTNLPLPHNMASPPQSMAPPQLPALPFSHHSDPAVPQFHNGSSMPRSPSGRSVASAPRIDHDLPPVPIRPAGSHLSADSAGMLNHAGPSRSRSAEPLRPQLNVITTDPLFPPRRPNPDGPAIQSPSARFSSFPLLDDPKSHPNSNDPSPPTSPVEEDATTLTGPALISAQMKCKIFLQQAHSQWKSLGSGKLKLYKQKQGNVKQLVVESDSNKGAIIISTIILTDGVERVAKTGVAVEVSDKGQRTGIIYMIQLRNENSAMGLFESLLVGSDRAVNR